MGGTNNLPHFNALGTPRFAWHPNKELSLTSPRPGGGQAQAGKDHPTFQTWATPTPRLAYSKS